MTPVFNQDQSPFSVRESVLPDATVLRAHMMPVGVDSVQLSAFVPNVPAPLRALCRLRFRNLAGRSICVGRGGHDGFSFSLYGPLGQRNPQGMQMVIRFNPNTLDHYDSETGAILVRGDNTMAYNPQLLTHALHRLNWHLKSLGVVLDAFDFAVSGVDFTRDILFLHPDLTKKPHDGTLPPFEKTSADLMVESILQLLSWSITPYLPQRDDYVNKAECSVNGDKLEGLIRRNKRQIWAHYDKTLERQQKQAKAQASGEDHGPTDFMSHSARQLRLEWRIRKKQKIINLGITTARQLDEQLASVSVTRKLDLIFDFRLQGDFLRSYKPYSRQMPKIDARWLATLSELSADQRAKFNLLAQPSPRNLSSKQRKRLKSNQETAVDALVKWLDAQGSQAVFESLEAAYLPHNRKSSDATKRQLIRLLAGAPVAPTMHSIWPDCTTRAEALESLQRQLLLYP